MTSYIPSARCAALPRAPSEVRPTVRQLVRIVRGPMAGLVAYLCEPATCGRCLVEVPLWGQGVFLRLDAALLELDGGEGAGNASG